MPRQHGTQLQCQHDKIPSVTKGNRGASPPTHNDRKSHLCNERIYSETPLQGIVPCRWTGPHADRGPGGLRRAGYSLGYPITQNPVEKYTVSLSFQKAEAEGYTPKTCSGPRIQLQKAF